MEILNKNIVQKIRNLPKDPGVYIYRDINRRVIYVGKAINLKNRVNTYFKGKNLDPKTAKLVENIDNLEYIVCGSEIEALLLESELIKRYKPKYNIDWKDDKNYCYIKITKDDYPKIFVMRQLSDTKSQYFGPFVDVKAVKNSLKVLRKIFPYCTCGLSPDKVCLYYHLGLCNGHGQKYISSLEYQKTVNNLIAFLSGKKEKIMKDMRKEMLNLSRQQEYEKAAVMRNRLLSLDKIKLMHILESQRDLNLDKALSGIKKMLGLSKIPERIECYDISNISGKFAVGSMIVFEKGVPKKKDYRRFEIKNVKQINDFAMLQEVLHRRFIANRKGNDQSFKSTPDLIIIDGGKGQLSAVKKELKTMGIAVITIGLAKKKEEIFYLDQKDHFYKIETTKDTEVRFLLQRIRDEAHRFAITYHRNLRSKVLTESVLDTIVGIGPISKRLLVKNFGTIKNIKEAKEEDIAKIVGPKIAAKIKKEL
ncbi:MAG: excinuclease ABC subunit UvrC [Patescibacteria group bacterium]